MTAPMTAVRLAAALALLLAAPAAPARDAPKLTWEEMVPAKTSNDALAVTSSAPVPGLDGRTVQLPGFIVPLESDEGGLISEFLLVPYFGACIHVPPPPPNQLVYVTLEEPFNLVSLQQPYWIEGTLQVEEYSSEVADSHYTMRAHRISKYNY
ncbi:DUF3299 domain-containing protein [Lentisalinibacter salinarum]|uniref:DUF3299 domain-containing protein n=1 Tax=Lentisalinibacter salinarum TaxID=2992239 RepID=UPI003864A650